MNLKNSKLEKNSEKNWGSGISPQVLKLKYGLRPIIVPCQNTPLPKKPWRKRYWESKFECWSTFAQNWWTLAYVLRIFLESPWTGLQAPKILWT